MLFGILAVLATAGTAFADRIDNTTYTLNGGVSGFNLVYDGTAYNGAYAVQFSFDTGNYNVDANPLHNLQVLGNQNGIIGYCIDLRNNAIEPSSYKLIDTQNAPIPDSEGGNPGVGMGAARATALSKLWYANFAASNANSITKAAFQLAIWEVVYEDSATLNILTDPTGDGFKVAAGVYDANQQLVINTAQSYLNSIATTNGQANLVALSNVVLKNGAWVNGVGQDYVVEVPTPACIVSLLGLGGTLGMIGLMRRRRNG